MSETDVKITIPKQLRDKLLNISEQIHKLNTGATDDNLWLGQANDGGYDWGQTDIGVNKSGQLIISTQSGCSCYGAEEPSVDETHDLKKPIKLKDSGYYNTLPGAVAETKSIANVLYKILNDKPVTTKEVIGIPNAEVRRAVVEIVGYDKIIKTAKKLDSSSDGDLFEVPLENDENIVLVHVKDPSTTREYFLRVPPQMKTAKQARAWTFGFEEADFDLAKET